MVLSIPVTIRSKAKRLIYDLLSCQYYIDVVEEIMNMECWSNYIDREHYNTLIKPCPSTTLCTTNPGTGLGSNPSFCGERLTTNRRPMLVGVLLQFPK